MSFDTDVPVLPAAAIEQSRLVQLLVGLLLQLEELCATRKQRCDILIRARQYRTVLHLDVVDQKHSGLLAPLETQLAAPSSASADPRLYLFHTELADVGGKLEVTSTDREDRLRLFLPISSDQKTSFSEVIGSTTLKTNEDYQL